MSTFGSYAAHEVTWLLTDLSAVPLEQDLGSRERQIQDGRPYFEMLPVEYQPDQTYLDHFHASLAVTAGRVARAVAVVSEQVLTETGGPPVLVSLARAGTPIGILMRRWYQQAHGLEVPHYAISILRGGGIDTAALDHVLARHEAAQVQFVDGWTGKGAIIRELQTAITEYVEQHPSARGLRSHLAVLADPGSCTHLFGTREDFLIPSACLNSTVSGLVSRTVYRKDLIAPGAFHGAKFYAELAGDDVSNLYLDTVSAAFPDPASALVVEGDRTPTWAGWAAVETIAAEYGLTNLNLVKPGVGETTRVLLRRIPWQVLVRPADRAGLAHVEQLAKDRGVPVVERADLPYACVGLIRPTGTSGDDA